MRRWTNNSLPECANKARVVLETQCSQSWLWRWHLIEMRQERYPCTKQADCVAGGDGRTTVCQSVQPRQEGYWRIKAGSLHYGDGIWLRCGRSSVLVGNRRTGSLSLPRDLCFKSQAAEYLEFKTYKQNMWWLTWGGEHFSTRLFSGSLSRSQEPDNSKKWDRGTLPLMSQLMQSTFWK